MSKKHPTKDTATDIPMPPERLRYDRRLLNTDDASPDWESRRCSKMRERFPISSGEQVRGLNLVTPVQPSLPRTHL